MFCVQSVLSKNWSQLWFPVNQNNNMETWGMNIDQRKSLKWRRRASNNTNTYSLINPTLNCLCVQYTYLKVHISMNAQSLLTFSECLFRWAQTIAFFPTHACVGFCFVYLAQFVFILYILDYHDFNIILNTIKLFFQPKFISKMSFFSLRKFPSARVQKKRERANKDISCRWLSSLFFSVIFFFCLLSILSLARHRCIRTPTQCGFCEKQGSCLRVTDKHK